VPNCSAITSGAWFGSMIPPDPTRIVDVPPATWAMTTDVAALAIPGMEWCSATQNRLNTSRSACRARSSVLWNDSAAVPPWRIGERSRTENGISDSGFMAFLGARSRPKEIPPIPCRVTPSGRRPPTRPAIGISRLARGHNRPCALAWIALCWRRRCLMTCYCCQRRNLLPMNCSCRKPGHYCRNCLLCWFHCRCDARRHGCARPKASGSPGPSRNGPVSTGSSSASSRPSPGP
jgi:hypothetical protein